MSAYLSRFLYRVGRSVGKLIKLNAGICAKTHYIARGIYFMITGAFPEEEIKDKAIIKENMNTLMFMIMETREGKPLLNRSLPVPNWYNQQYSLGIEPSINIPVSQFCTQSQFEESVFLEWCTLLKESNCYHRKLWENVYIMQALKHYGYMKPGKEGLGFGVGLEPLPALMASFGCRVTATDQQAEVPASKQWAATGQHSSSLNQLNSRNICPEDVFSERVSFRAVDMNLIPDELTGFDFIWSSCALEHLGSKRQCIDFIFNSLDCLIPGGMAVHTTEFNLSSNYKTLNNSPTVLFRYLDIEGIEKALNERGCRIDINFQRGTLPFDNYVDFEPCGLPHLNLMCSEYVSTSFGMIIHKQ